ncbi:MAG: hypothetical protein Q9186_007013 [Xanthomendoza sp. 1 TL-2023]
MAMSDVEVPLEALPTDARPAASCDEQHSPTSEETNPQTLQSQLPTAQSGRSNRFFTLIQSRKVESSLLAICTFIALAALVLQARSSYGTTATIAMSDMQHLPQCQNIDSPQFWRPISDSAAHLRPRSLGGPSLSNITRPAQPPSSHSDAGAASKQAPDAATTRSQEPLEDTPSSFFDTWKYGLLVALFQFLWCYYCDSILQRATTARKSRLKDKPNLKRDKHEEQAAKGKKTCVEEGGWSYVVAYVLPHLLLRFVRSLASDQKADQACYGILCMMIVSYTFFASRLQKLRNDAQVEEDEEARAPEKTELDMRTIRNYTRSLVRRLIKSSVKGKTAAASTSDSPVKEKEAVSAYATGFLLGAWIWMEQQTPKPRRRNAQY